MLLKNNSRRLITLNEQMIVDRDADGGIVGARYPKKHLIKPASKAVEVPDEFKTVKFVQALIEDGSIAVIGDVVDADIVEETSGADDAFEVFKMSKDELEAFAKENFNIDLDKRKGVEKLRDEVAALLEA